MLGVLITFALAFLAAFGGYSCLNKHRDRLDPAERFGLGGLIVLGGTGLLMLPLLWLPSGVMIATVTGLLVIIGLPFIFAKAKLWTTLKPSPQPQTWFLVAAVTILSVLPLIAVLAPSDSTDWDSLAYHLAVPKLWIEAGRAGYVEGIHHSNFPFTVDNLYILGLQYGGQSGAKAFSLAFLILGSFALFGLARRWYGEAAGRWAVLGLAGAPVILWESGTAYIDVAHGLFGGLGILYAGELVFRRLSGEDAKVQLWLAAILLSLSAGSKYTGLQIITVAGLASLLLMFLLRQKDKSVDWKSPILVGLLAIALASPWYIKNALVVQNPTYPFFSEKLGGKDWGAWNAMIYRDEQQSFGVGRTEAGRDPSTFGHAVLGLSYQPGRYVNPQQTLGLGFPTGAIGILPLAALFFWAASGRAGPREKTILLAFLLLFGLWFFLSQQSRYLTTVVVPGAVLAGGAIVSLRLGKTLSILAGAQAAFTFFMLWTLQTADQLPAAMGSVSREEYQSKRVAFYVPAQAINSKAGVKRVALYDEVFGYFLDKPYMWANPGHGTMIPYQKLNTGAEFVAELQRQGFTHIYLNLQFMTPDVRERWAQAAGLAPGDGYSQEETGQMFEDPNAKWRWLLADAARNSKLAPAEFFPQSILFEIAP